MFREEMRKLRDSFSLSLCPMRCATRLSDQKRIGSPPVRSMASYMDVDRDESRVVRAMYLKPK